MSMDSKRAKELIPGYLDGELSEEQASALRAHLIDNPQSRIHLQDLTSIKAWFVAAEAPPVPVGFAARVARRAFAGDLAQADREQQLFESEGLPVGLALQGAGRASQEHVLAPFQAASTTAAQGTSLESTREGRLLSFVLASTVAAAAILLTLCMTLANQTRPETDRLEAAEAKTRQQILEELDELNRLEAAPAGMDSSQTPNRGQ